jgi:hypothetical protein
MITKEEISSIGSFNLDLLREAIRQAELRINDENARKERIDKRAFTLFSFFLGIIGLIFTAIQIGLESHLIALELTASILIISVALLFTIVRSASYSPLGAIPEFWLQKEILESKNNKNEDTDTLGYMLTHILYSAQNSISTSDISNTKRIKLLDKVLLISIIALLPIIVSIGYDILLAVCSRF